MAPEGTDMKIESIRIKNLRSFADEIVSCNDYTCLVGPNGSGKSTILCALNVFFREIDSASTDLSQLDLEDFHLKNPEEPIEVTVTFTDTTFRLSSASLESGATTFVVVNHGKRRHVFTIKGPGVNGMHTATLAAGQSAKLTVQLRAGAYVLSDPVGLGAYNVQFLDVVRSAVLTGTGGTNVVAPPVTPPPMCGATYTP